MDSISRFKKSYAVLQSFYERWLVRLGERCEGHDQRQAAYYVWARYSMSIRTLDAILDPHLIPDLSVICRGCLEFDVSLRLFEVLCPADSATKTDPTDVGQS